MAGTDPIGTKWGCGYDKAAQGTLEGIAAAVDRMAALASAIAACGINREAAVAYSAADSSGRVPPRTPVGVSVSTTAPWIGSSIGKSTPEPRLWHLVQQAVGYAWPDGSESLLEEAAGYWSNLQLAIIHAKVSGFNEAKVLIQANTAPELDRIASNVARLQTLLANLEKACGLLGSASWQYGASLASLHLQVNNLLWHLDEQLFAWGVTGLATTVITAGASDAVAAATAEALTGDAAAQIAIFCYTFTMEVNDYIGLLSDIEHIIQDIEAIIRILREIQTIPAAPDLQAVGTVSIP